jgi:alkanesulfonate monooxygenase SsuD/methylene tetrahydromethanopterin reductase-like flavin-dependent oxidoreductase (luciferase family)
VAYAREYVQTLRSLLDGGPVDHDGPELTAHVQLARDRPSPPLILAAVGPQMLRLAGEVADGAITWLCDAEHLMRVALPALTRGAEAAGRDIPQLFAGLPMIVHDDLAEGRAAADLWLGEHSQLEAYRNALDRVSSGRSPGDVALVGTEASITDQVRELFDLGVTEVGLVPLPAGADILRSLDRAHDLVASLAQAT